MKKGMLTGNEENLNRMATKRFPQCTFIRYCSKGCLKKSWKQHKLISNEIREKYDNNAISDVEDEGISSLPFGCSI